MSICPSGKADKIETYRAEPYVYAQMTAGPDAATAGEAKNSWLTGTASWSFVTISQYILGIKPSHAGLVIDPCIPASWPGYTVHRRFRGKTYNIKVRNSNGVSKGVRSMTVDGNKVDGNLIDPSLGSDRVDVVVEMG